MGRAVAKALIAVLFGGVCPVLSKLAKASVSAKGAAETVSKYSSGLPRSKHAFGVEPADSTSARLT